MGDKPFLTLENQILLLESRGLIVPDRDKAKKILLTTNYYYLVNGYSQFLFDFSKNKYFIGATFDELLTIYGYDKDIKATLYASLMRAESFLASLISHVFCELHGGGYSYLNTTNFSSDKKHTLEIARLISTCATVINRNKKLNQIKHYQKNHGDVPLWVAVSHFEFGLLSRFFELMNEKERAKITRIINDHLASEHNIRVRLTPKQIDAYIYNLRMIRNVCAHDNRMLSIELANLPAQKDLMDIDGQRNTLFPHLLMMKCFLNASQYNILIASLKKRTKNLDRKLQKYSTRISANDIASSLGFPEDWHKS